MLCRTNKCITLEKGGFDIVPKYTTYSKAVDSETLFLHGFLASVEVRLADVSVLDP